MVAKRWVVVVGLAAGFAGAAPAALATGFDGSCQVAGEGGFVAPGGYVPGANRWWMEGRGGCTGTLDGVKVVNHPVRLRVEFEDPVAGCAASLAAGDGTLTFETGKRRGKVLRFAQDHVGPVASITGGSSGMGLAYLTAYTQLARQDPASVSQCATGTLTWFAAEWAMKTVGTLEG